VSRSKKALPRLHVHLSRTVVLSTARKQTKGPFYIGRTNTLNMSNFDHHITVFSPQGHLYQIGWSSTATFIHNNF
jgi:hypothetical protein